MVSSIRGLAGSFMGVHVSQVLVVDDSSMLRMLVSFTLSGADRFDVREAKDANEALDALARERFAMMLTDFHMPGMDGVQLTRAVRRIPEHSAMPILMMSGDDDPVVEAAAVAAGVDGFLRKPFEPSELHSAMRRLVEDSMVAQGASIPHRFGPAALLDAFPYPAMVVAGDHTVLIGNAAYYAMSPGGISDRPPLCREVVHGERGQPVGCPLLRAVATEAPAESLIDDPLRGPLLASVYPMDRASTGGRALYLHLVRPSD